MGGAIVLIIIGAFLLFAFLADRSDIRKEKKRFNNGICPNCGEFLQHEGESDYLDRIYVCPECNHTVKIPPCSHIDKRYCNILDEIVWTINCQNCKSKEYCQYNKKDNGN